MKLAHKITLQVLALTCILAIVGGVIYRQFFSDIRIENLAKIPRPSVGTYVNRDASKQSLTIIYGLGNEYKQIEVCWNQKLIDARRTFLESYMGKDHPVFGRFQTRKLVTPKSSYDLIMIVDKTNPSMITGASTVLREKPIMLEFSGWDRDLDSFGDFLDGIKILR